MVFPRGDHCIFCGDEIAFSSYNPKKIVVVSVEYEYDGAMQQRRYWAHELCLPEELKSDG